MNTLLKKYRKQRYAWLRFLLFSKIEGSLPIALRILLSLQPFCCNIYRKYYQENKKVKSTSGNTALKIIEKLESLVSNLRLKYSQMFSLLFLHSYNCLQSLATETFRIIKKREKNLLSLLIPGSCIEIARHFVLKE